MLVEYLFCFRADENADVISVTRKRQVCLFLSVSNPESRVV